MQAATSLCAVEVLVAKRLLASSIRRTPLWTVSAVGPNLSAIERITSRPQSRYRSASETNHTTRSRTPPDTFPVSSALSQLGRRKGPEHYPGVSRCVLLAS